MLSQRSSHDQPVLRPLWQLLLADQTDLLPALTCVENRALLDFLVQMVAEGSRLDRLESQIVNCLINSRHCD